MVIFQQGDIVYMDFDPQVGHEQRGRRPAVIVSNAEFQRRTNFAIVCPITNTDRNYPLHIPLDEATKTTGFVMCDQIKSLDIARRNVEYAEKLPANILESVKEIISAFI